MRMTIIRTALLLLSASALLHITSARPMDADQNSGISGSKFAMTLHCAIAPLSLANGEQPLTVARRDSSGDDAAKGRQWQGLFGLSRSLDVGSAIKGQRLANNAFGPGRKRTLSAAMQ